MKRPLFSNRSRVKLSGASLKNEGTFALRAFPFPSDNDPSSFVVDRWTPIDDRSKDIVTSWEVKNAEWITTNVEGVWFGFEPVVAIVPAHLVEYYNIVVIRPKFLDKVVALKLIK